MFAVSSGTRLGDPQPPHQGVGHWAVTGLDGENEDHILAAILKLKGESLTVLFHTPSQRQQPHSAA